MHVAFLSHNAKAGDAIGNQIAEKLLYFLERGCAVRVFLEDRSAVHPDVQPYVELLSAHNPDKASLAFLAEADLIVVEYGQYYALLELLPRLSSGRAKILFDYHGVTPARLWPGQNRAALERGVQSRGLVWFADACVVHSRFMREELLRDVGYPTTRLHQLGFPLDLPSMGRRSSSSKLRQRLGVSSAPLLLHVGRFAPSKRIDLAIQALALLGDLPEPVHLVCVGDVSDLYQEEAKHCQLLAEELGVADRLHILGQVCKEDLDNVYHSGNVLVVPSLHEGFCIPIIEAMAAGLPVVASRSAALPETVGSAGLTFTAEDANDLAGQLRRVLVPERTIKRTKSGSRRVAIVAFRFGPQIVGGAETSLYEMAQALRQAGCTVEVFTTCTLSESHWANELPEGTIQCDGLTVHRFALDPPDRERHLQSVRRILEAQASPSDQDALDYLTHSIHSRALLDALDQAQSDLDAIIVGPYLFGLTYDVAQAFPEKTILVPCFHDEPFARLPMWRRVYEQVAGVLYHSPEEQEFAEMELGLSHPGAAVIGTHLDTSMAGNAKRGQSLIGTSRPYLVYCGRYSIQKNVPLLLEFLERYQQLHPDRFSMVFLGKGETALPNAPWIKDLGFVEEQTKRDVIAGAAALVQLSELESLSIVVLEAWAQATPVLVHAACGPLVGHLRRAGGGGRAIADFAGFTAALDDLWEHPEAWAQAGRTGQEHVRREFGLAETFQRKLLDALDHKDKPLAEQMRLQGLARAARFERSRWRSEFGRVVASVLESPPRQPQHLVRVQFQAERKQTAIGQAGVLVPVRLVNEGSVPALVEGRSQTLLHCWITDDSEQEIPESQTTTSLPRLLVPGQELSAAVRIHVPQAPGSYRVYCEARCQDMAATSERAMLRLDVQAIGEPSTGCCSEHLQRVGGALASAEEGRRLPDDYVDITQGKLAGLKRSIKRKMLGNFKHAYVDVLSRQQSGFNQQILAALAGLAECCAILDHAHSARAGLAPDVSPDVLRLLQDLAARLEKAEQRNEELVQRLQQLESAMSRV